MTDKKLQPIQAVSFRNRHDYHDLFRNAPTGYVCIDMEGLITEINEPAEFILGKKAEQLIGLPFEKFIGHKDKKFWCHDCLHSEQRKRHECEIQLTRGDGSKIFVHLDCLIIDSNIAYPQLRITLTDISERKLVYETMSLAASAFETRIGIMVTDKDKVILKINSAFTEITGYDASDVLGKTPSILRSEVSDDEFYRAMWSTINRKGHWQGEIWDIRQNGQTFSAWLTITAIKDRQGHVKRYVGSLTDLTPQKRKQKELLDTRHELEAKIAATNEKVRKINNESLFTKVALEVLLKQLETTVTKAQGQLSVELEKTVMPFFNKIKKLSRDKEQQQLIGVVESNLEYLIQSYGRSSNLHGAFQKLTPTEIQVATMVRQGLPTKSIASTLNLSAGTVNSHRKSIRKKLALDSKAINLASYLQSLSEETD